MQTRNQQKLKIALLLDIDDTLINFDASAQQQKIIWNGGAALWREYLKILRDEITSADNTLHIGIATYKQEYSTEDAEKKYRGDLLSAGVLEDTNYFQQNSEQIGLGENLGLGNIINNALVFFTGEKSKVTHAIEPAIIALTNENSEEEIIVILVDDDKQTCKEARKAGHIAICVNQLSKLQPAQQESYIALTFFKIFAQIGHMPPIQILNVCSTVDTLEEFDISDDENYEDEEKYDIETSVTESSESEEDETHNVDREPPETKHEEKPRLTRQSSFSTSSNSHSRSESRKRKYSLFQPLVADDTSQESNADEISAPAPH